jgi:hypothetical protein
LQSFTLAAGTESYAYSVLPSGGITMDILNITAIWGNQRIALRYMSFTEFNSKMRPWTAYQDIPAVFSIYGQNTFYIGPSPSQNFACEFDTVIQPNSLVDDTTVEQIMYPYTAPVSYYAASLAKEKEQAFEEADRFKQAYLQKAKDALQATMTRRIPNAYR